MAMLLPIGLSADKCDEILFSDFSNFSAMRGDAAHRSISLQVTQGIDPKDEYDRVVALVDRLTPLDEELELLLVDAIGT
jgi:hypothetical protein